MNKKVLCNKALFVLRILLGLAMVYFGYGKIGAPNQKIQFIGSAGHDMGLTFLSVTTWYWIALIGQILAGLLILIGGKWSKIGATLTLIIMIFIGNKIGWDFSNINFTLVTLASLVILFYGAGCWSDDPNCCDGTCNTGMDLGKVAGVGAMIGAGTQLLDSVKDTIGNVGNIDALKNKIGDLGDIANLDGLKDKATGLVDGAKDLIANHDMLQSVTKKAESIIELAQDHVETITDKVENYADQAKDLISKADDILPDSVSEKLNNTIDYVQDKIADAKEVVANIADKANDAIEVIDANSKKA